MWINAPLAIWCVLALARRSRWRDAGLGIACAAAGALVWAVPLVWDSGGLAKYLESVQSQGSADFTGVQMLWTRPSRELFALSLERTFIDPWVSQRFAQIVVLAALGGLVWLARKRRDILALVLVTFLPYLVFHFLFQEAITLRYALPIVVALAGCVIIGLGAISARVAAFGALAAMMAGVLYAHPRLEAYASGGWPVDRAMQDMIAARASEPEPPVLRTHHQVWHGIQRVFDWYRPVWDVGRQPFPGDREWLDVDPPLAVGRHRARLVSHRSHPQRRRAVRSPIAASRRPLREPGPRPRAHRRRDAAGRLELVAARAAVLDARTGLVAHARGRGHDGKGRARSPDQTRRGVRPPDDRVARLVVGGRHLDAAGAPAEIAVELDGRPLRAWTAAPDRPWFVEWIDLPAGTLAGAGPYATLTVSARSATPGRPAPWIGLEQFDAAPERFGRSSRSPTGWHELEHDPRLGRTWRWSSRRSVLTVRGGAGDLRLTLAGEAPRRYFDRPPVVIVKAGAAEIARFSPFDDFTQEIVVPIAALAGGERRDHHRDGSRVRAGGTRQHAGSPAARAEAVQDRGF